MGEASMHWNFKLCYVPNESTLLANHCFVIQLASIYNGSKLRAHLLLFLAKIELQVIVIASSDEALIYPLRSFVKDIMFLTGNYSLLG